MNEQERNTQDEEQEQAQDQSQERNTQDEEQEQPQGQEQDQPQADEAEEEPQSGGGMSDALKGAAKGAAAGAAAGAAVAGVAKVASSRFGGDSGDESESPAEDEQSAGRDETS